MHVSLVGCCNNSSEEQLIKTRHVEFDSRSSLGFFKKLKTIWVNFGTFLILTKNKQIMNEMRNNLSPLNRLFAIILTPGDVIGPELDDSLAH